MKNKLKKTFIYQIYLFSKYLFFPFKLFFNKVNKSRPNFYLNTYDTKKTNIVVSLTSFPGRIDIVHKTIWSIYNQNLKPDCIVLWLSTKQFPRKEKDLPNELLYLIKIGLIIQWTEDDLKSYKKLIPALKKYPNDIIVTADDDLYYPKYWLHSLYESYKRYPNDIHCHMITPLEINENNTSINKSLKDVEYNSSSYLYKILGGSGALYPPSSFDKNVFDKKIFIEIAPTSDDIWFWGNAVKNHKKIRLIKGSMKKLINTEFSQEKTDCLYKINDSEQNLFYKHLNNVFNYLELNNIINDESSGGLNVYKK